MSARTQIVQKPPTLTDLGQVDQLKEQLRQLQIALDLQTQAHDALESKKCRYEELFEYLPAGVYQVSKEGRLISANSALLRMLGLSNLIEAAEVLESSSEAPLAFLETMRQKLDDEGELDGIERSFVRRSDGAHLFLRERAKAVDDLKGHTRFYEGVVEDVTATYRARILESDSNRILQLMAAHYPIEQVMVEIAEMVVRQWPGTSCVVYQRTGDLLYRFAQAGAFDDVGDPVLQHLHISVDTPNFAMPALNGRRESRFATPNAPGYWSLPIQSGDHALLGVITVFGPWKAEPDLEQSSVLETASRLAAVALEQRQLRIDLQHRVFYDALTELPNRALLETRIEVAASFARKHGHRVGLLCFDLDRFKEVNETLGHQVGDALLRAVADRISVQLPSELLLARLGGDEFALLIPDMHSVREILVASEAILQALSEPFYLGQHTLCASASIGMAVFPDDCADSCLLHSHADSAMYFAKSKGRNSVQRYHPNAVSWVRGRIETETGLRRALTGNQLALHFQPVANENRELIGVEALVRWRHPERGLLFPGAFLSVAEDSGLIVPIGRWILEEACRQAGAWRKTRPLNVSVNVSFLQLQEPGLTNVVADLLAKYSLSPELLTLELTESTLMRNADEAARQLAGLRALGVRVAVDDFGTGYSSLSYLQSLPLDSLKIDRSFVAHLGHANDKADAIVRAIIGLAKTFDLRVIAEGVETLEQFQALRDLGADHFQGYYFGQAMPADRITDCLSKSTPVSLPLS